MLHICSKKKEKKHSGSDSEDQGNVALTGHDSIEKSKGEARGRRRHKHRGNRNQQLMIDAIGKVSEATKYRIDCLILKTPVLA